MVAGRPVRQWVLASYLIGKEQAAAIYLCAIQGYGNWSAYPEWTAPVGAAHHPPVEERSGLWRRDFSSTSPDEWAGARALVNPSALMLTVTLPSGRWFSLYGEAQPSTLILPPFTAATLLRAAERRAESRV